MGLEEGILERVGSVPQIPCLLLHTNVIIGMFRLLNHDNPKKTMELKEEDWVVSHRIPCLLLVLMSFFMGMFRQRM